MRPQKKSGHLYQSISTENHQGSTASRCFADQDAFQSKSPILAGFCLKPSILTYMFGCCCCLTLLGFGEEIHVLSFLVCFRCGFCFGVILIFHLCCCCSVFMSVYVAILFALFCISGTRSGVVWPIHGKG